MALSKKSGLGRGLDAIFVDNSAEDAGGVTLLRITDIEPRANQPRKVFDSDALAELADSIATHGLIQPVVVRENHEGFYSIIAGERRWRAAKMAGLTEIPVVILDVDDAKAAELALVENLQREDLNPVEEAQAYKTLSEEYSLTQEQIAQRVGRSRSAVANSLRLLDLPQDILRMLSDDELSPGHARTLLALERKTDMKKLADLIVRGDFNVRKTEELVKKYNKSLREATENENITDEPLKIDWNKQLEKKMTERLGRRVKISDSPRKKALELTFEDSDDLSSLVTLLCGDNIFDE